MAGGFGIANNGPLPLLPAGRLIISKKKGPDRADQRKNPGHPVNDSGGVMPTIWGGQGTPFRFPPGSADIGYGTIPVSPRKTRSFG